MLIQGVESSVGCKYKKTNMITWNVIITDAWLNAIIILIKQADYLVVLLCQGELKVKVAQWKDSPQAKVAQWKDSPQVKVAQWKDSPQVKDWIGLLYEQLKWTVLMITLDFILNTTFTSSSDKDHMTQADTYRCLMLMLNIMILNILIIKV